MHRALSVYLVEDSPILLGLLTRLLGVERAIRIVGHADSASGAIAAIGALQPDAIVVDLVLREGNGLDVLETVCQAKSRPVALVLTNHTTRAYRDAAARLGVDRFYDKSSDIPEMFRFLKDLADSRRAAS